MSFFERLLQFGAPWWVVVGLIVFLVVSVLLLAMLVPDLLKRPVRREGATQSQKVIINNYGTDNPFDRVNRGRSDPAGRGQWRLAQELDMLKSDGDEVHVYDLPPEKE
jgi:hypothetical protein